MGKPLRVLLVEDSKDDAELILYYLERGGFTVTYERVDTPGDMRLALQQKTWDFILSDFALPQFSGLQALRLYSELALDTPFIVVSGTIGEDTAVQMMKAGASDYIMKDNLSRLPPAVERELQEVGGRRARKRAEKVQQMLYVIAQTANATTDLPSFFGNLHSILGELMHAPNFYIALYDAASNLISFPYFVDEREDCPEPYPPGSGLTAYVLRVGEPLLANRQRLIELQDENIGFLGPSAQSWLGIPLYGADRTIGVMAIQSYDPAVIYTEDDLAILDFISDQVELVIQRKQAEQALRESEATMRIMIDAATDAALFMTDRSGCLLALNEHFAQRFGSSVEALMGKRVPDLLPPDLAASRSAVMQEMIDSKTSVSFEDYRDGRWLDNTAYPVLDADGEVAKMALYSRDVTARKQAQEALRLSEEKFSKVFHISPDAIAIIRLRDGILLDVNDGFEVLSGYLHDEVVGLTVDQMPVWVDPVAWGMALADLEKTGELHDVEFNLRHRNGSVWVGLTSARLIEIQGEVCALVFVRNITNRKLAEERLHRLNRALQIISECNQGLIRDNDEPALFNDVCRILVDYGNYRLAWIGYAVTSKANPVALAASDGLAVAYLRAAGWSKTEPSAGFDPACETMKQNDIVLFNDIAADPAYGYLSAAAAENGLQAMAALPLLFNEQCYGVLAVYAGQANFFDTDEMALLRELAGDLAYGIHTLRTRGERRLAMAMLEKSSAELAQAYDATLEGWAYALELREKETAGHSKRVVERTIHLARALGIGEEALVHIRRGALLHDIGKMGIPDSILLKPSPLSDDEWVVMRQHPNYAFSLLSGIAYLRPALDIPYCHHEKWDGTGYPRGLKGTEIPLAARIFAVMDVWDALTSDRPYRPAWPIQDVREYILDQSGRHFDPHVVDVFLKTI